MDDGSRDIPGKLRHAWLHYSDDANPEASQQIVAGLEIAWQEICSEACENPLADEWTEQGGDVTHLVMVQNFGCNITIICVCNVKEHEMAPQLTMGALAMNHRNENSQPSRHFLEVSHDEVAVLAMCVAAGMPGDGTMTMLAKARAVQEMNRLGEDGLIQLVNKLCKAYDALCDGRHTKVPL